MPASFACDVACSGLEDLGFSACMQRVQRAKSWGGVVQNVEKASRTLKQLHTVSEKYEGSQDGATGASPGQGADYDSAVAPSVHDSQMSMPTSSAENSIQVRTQPAACQCLKGSLNSRSRSCGRLAVRRSLNITHPLAQWSGSLKYAAFETDLWMQAAQTERVSPAQAQGGSPRAKGGILRKPGASGSADDLRRLPARGAQLPGSPTVSWHRSVTDRDLHRRPPLSNIFPSALSPRSACRPACCSVAPLLRSLPLQAKTGRTGPQCAGQSDFAPLRSGLPCLSLQQSGLQRF